MYIRVCARHWQVYLPYVFVHTRVHSFCAVTLASLLSRVVGAPRSAILTCIFLYPRHRIKFHALSKRNFFHGGAWSVDLAKNDPVASFFSLSLPIRRFLPLFFPSFRSKSLDGIARTRNVHKELLYRVTRLEYNIIYYMYMYNIYIYVIYKEKIIFY